MALKMTEMSDVIGKDQKILHKPTIILWSAIKAPLDRPASEETNGKGRKSPLSKKSPERNGAKNNLEEEIGGKRKRRAKKSLSRGLGFNHSRKIKGPPKGRSDIYGPYTTFLSPPVLCGLCMAVFTHSGRVVPSTS